MATRRQFCQQIGLGAASLGFGMASLGFGMASLGFGMASLAVGSPAFAKPNRKPNIVFILVDDLGWSDLGCYGSDLHETPNIDRLASQSMTFTQAYSASPVCSPTRASIMTGKNPARLRMTVWHESAANPPTDRPLIPPVTVGNLPLQEITIAECLKDAGYRAAHVGKWHLGDAAHYPPTQGFDISVGATHWGMPYSFFYPYRGWRNEEEFRYIPGLDYGEPGEYLTDRLTDEALHAMEAMKDGPFFLHLAHHTVHTPIEGKPELVEQYRKKIKPGMRHANPGYAAMVHSLDENVGRVLAKLDALNLSDNTAVILMSDNGGFLTWRDEMKVTDNHPLRSGKGSLYEGGIRVPLIVRWPGATQEGGRCDQMVNSADLYPTMLRMAGVEGNAQHNQNVDGMNIASLLSDPNHALERDEMFWHYPHYYPTTTPVSAMRQGDFKLIERFENGELELYNISEDIGETRNLAREAPEKAASMRRRLNAWRNGIHAQLPKANPNFPQK